MKLTIDFSDFRPWSGASDTWNRIEDEGKIDELEAVLEEIYPDGMSDTELNDLLRFEAETVFEWLGIGEEEEEEEEEEEDCEEFDAFCDHFSSCQNCPLHNNHSVGECIDCLNSGKHDKLMACIHGQERDKYDKSILYND